MSLYYERRGQGAPLVLIHGLFSSGRAWRYIIDTLTEQRDVIVVDLPGHGRSPTLEDLAPTPAELARQLTTLIHELRLDAAHLVGNSLGGWVALEMAKLGKALSVTALCPAGLWPTSTAWMRQLSLGIGNQAARLTTHLGPMPLEQFTPKLARSAIRHYLASPALRDQAKLILRERFRDGQAIQAPVTIALGARDWVLAPLRSDGRRELPPHTIWTVLPDCGHIPMYDNPALVAQLVLHATSTSLPYTAGVNTITGTCRLPTRCA